MAKRLLLALVGLVVAISTIMPTAAAAPVPRSATRLRGSHVVTIGANSVEGLPQGSYRTFDDYGYLRNALTHKCMGVAGGSIGNGALVLQWECARVPGSDQRMHMYPVESGNVWMTIDPFFDNGKCLGVAGSSQAWGAPLIQWTCARIEDQQFAFRITNESNPIRVEIFARHSSQAIGVAGGNPNDGAQIVQWPWQGNNFGCVGDQCWDILLD